MRQSLVFNLKAIVCQKLLPSTHPDRPRIPCCEIMLTNPSIRKLIADSRDFEITSVLKGAGEEGMQDFTISLKALVDAELIDRPTAFSAAPNREALKMALKDINVSQPGIL